MDIKFLFLVVLYGFSTFFHLCTLFLNLEASSFFLTGHLISDRNEIKTQSKTESKKNHFKIRLSVKIDFILIFMSNQFYDYYVLHINIIQ